jgi:hypothetical protein
MQKKTLVGIIVIVVMAVLGTAGYFAYKQFSKPKQVACTMEAKVCPDGSFVGRVGPNCEFAECPKIQDETAGWKTYRNENMGISFDYPSTWIYQEFSCNLDGVAFCLIKNGITGCEQTCGMDSPESPIYFYLDGWNNSKDKQKSFVLNDNKYKDIFDQMLFTFKFTK